MDKKEKLYFQAEDENGNPVGPLESDIGFQVEDDEGNPVGEVETDITFEEDGPKTSDKKD